MASEIEAELTDAIDQRGVLTLGGSGSNRVWVLPRALGTRGTTRVLVSEILTAGDHRQTGEYREDEVTEALDYFHPPTFVPLPAKIDGVPAAQLKGLRDLVI